MHDRPQFIDELQTLLSLHGDALRSLVGQRIERSWIAWDRTYDRWLAGEPVVLEIGGRQLEIQWTKIGEVAITQGRVDLRSPHEWKTFWAEVGGFDVEWRQDALPV